MSMGAGTAGVAYAQLEKTCERISRAQAQGRMFTDEPATAPEQQELGL